MIDGSPLDNTRDAADHVPAGTVWVNMTTLLRWRRPAVGVVRVEQRLARWILAHDEHVRFCRYDQATRTVVEVDRQQVAAQTALLEQIGRTPPQAPKVKKPKAKKQRNALGKILRRIGKAAGRAAGMLGPLLSRVETNVSATPRAGQNTAPPSPSPLRSGDVYVSLGSDWNDNDLGQLYERKQRDGFKVLGTCYDMIPMKFPHLTIPDTEQRFPKHVANLAWVADHVLCISRCSQQDFIEITTLLQSPTPETSVIRLGSDLSQATRHPAGAAQGGWTDGNNAVADAAASPFVLFVSTIERRKNHDILYRAWLRLIEAGCTIPNLVFVGMRGWGVDDLLSDLARDWRIRGRIYVLQTVSDTELAMLYDRCLYTVYPSLYEGWGLPVHESFEFGKFCLCSNGGSLPEAGGDLAEYLDPWDLNAWVERIRYFADHPDEIEKRNQMIARQFRPHSWHDTSRSIMLKAQELAQADSRRMT
jgi:glycosyltransferase involved in cell wall biosynthesis